MPASSAAPPAGLALELAGVRLTRGGAGQHCILDTLNLGVAAGEQLAVVGPSGSGKTSLLHLAAGALRPDAGSLRLGGQDFWRLPAAARQRQRRALFLAPQVPPLPPRLRVVTAVLAGRLPAMGFWRGLLSLVHPSELALAQAALGRFGLADRLFDRVDRLSGGERLRVALARALVSPARLWLLDEPLAALDPVQSDQVLEVLCDEAQRRGITLVVSLHQAELARLRFPRLVGLRAGGVAFDLPSGAIGAQHWQALYAGAPPPAGPGR